jgi:hypothetical protein
VDDDVEPAASPVEDDDADDSDELDDELESPSPPDPAPSDDERDPAFVPELDLPRSFFAQPDPLKWIAGAANCLRIESSAPQDGQYRGPGSLIPWRMSARWSQAEQR